MPSFSRAMSMIGRFLAACAISMSDLGDWCCEAGMGGPIVTILWVSFCCHARERGHCAFTVDQWRAGPRWRRDDKTWSCEPRASREARSLGPFAGRQLGDV